LGHAEIHPSGPFTAGDYTSFELIYTAGFFGIDDSGSIKIVQRFAGDMSTPQFDDPKAPAYLSAEASNGVTLLLRYDIKDNIRPWGKTLYIKIVRGYLREGDRIVVAFGDRRGGSPGIRMQTFCEDTFELKVLVDAFATYEYVELPRSPVVRIVAGQAVRWLAVLPTLRRVEEPFLLCLKAEDQWGNPADLPDSSILLEANLEVSGLPKRMNFAAGQPVAILENLRAEEPGDLFVRVLDSEGRLLTRSNPLRIAAAYDAEVAPVGVPPAGNEAGHLRPYWADMHGQSEETIGSNSARDYFRFARDRAFLDVCCHQGNDFQITGQFWQELQTIVEEFNEPGRFIAFPGYEWSGNTALGGDHNVIFLRAGEQIHRSSHALIYDLYDADSDRHTSRELFETLAGRDAFLYGHVGGRYADLPAARRAQRYRNFGGTDTHLASGSGQSTLRQGHPGRRARGLEQPDLPRPGLNRDCRGCLGYPNRSAAAIAREVPVCMNTPAAVAGTGSVFSRSDTLTNSQKNRTIGSRAASPDRG